MSKGTLNFNYFSSLSEKDPKILKTEKSWSPSVFPLNKGLRRNNSANMHPAAQISIETSYLVIHIISSGAL